jgi:hypothetical protein
MIVASHQKGWKIINQRSHGLLAAMLAYQYDIDLPNDIIVPTLITTAEHDDGIAETKENKNLTDAGAPKHFLAPGGSKKTDLKQHYNVMEIATSKSQLNALLTSMHMNFIFSGKKPGDDKELDIFLKDQAKNRKVILNHLEIDQEYADRLYCFVEWCDAFSLLICMDKIQPEGRKMEISENPDGILNQTFYKSENVISVDPWPFKTKTFKVFYEYKIIEQLEFKSIEEFDAVCSTTEVRRQEFVLSK